jgi:23S rRNA (guanosine2251-2'-O)-methyltransferase
VEKRSYQLFDALNTKAFYQDNERPVIIADNLRTPENMGAVLRLAGNIGALKTIFISTDAQHFRKFKIKRTASGAAEKTAWQVIADPGELSRLIPPGYQLIALETSQTATDIFKFRFPCKTAFLIGNEVTGIRDELFARASQALYIPLPGNISSLNVTHALTVGLFEWYRQMNG